MKQNPSSMVARWSIAMQELDYLIHFVSGFQNEWADTQSRICPNILELSMDYTPKILDSPGLEEDTAYTVIGSIGLQPGG